ncbi:MAG TPA: hypothetical protein VF070_15645 [Streptosporangiaceae bacterium]
MHRTRFWPSAESWAGREKSDLHGPAAIGSSLQARRTDRPSRARGVLLAGGRDADPDTGRAIAIISSSRPRQYGNPEIA